MASKTVFALAVVVVVISTVAADDTSRTGQTEQCPRQGLCPFVRNLMLTDVVGVNHMSDVYQSTAGQPINVINPGFHGLQVAHSGYHSSPMGQPLAHPVPAVFFYPHQIHRRDAPPSQHASICGNLCTSDHQCPGNKKCCATECGFSCFDPVYIAAH